MSRGFILPVVLLVLAALSAMATTLISETRTELAIARNIRASAEAEALADAGVYYMLAQLVRRRYPQSPEFFETWQFGDGRFKIYVEPESGKIDLNKGHQDLIEGLLNQSGLAPAQANQMAVRIEAYRDINAGRYFTSLEQFGDFLNLNQDIIKNIRPSATVYTALPGIAPHSAPKAVLDSIPGLGKTGVVSALSNQEDPKNFTPGTLAALARFTVEAIPVYTIIIEVETKQRARFRRMVVVNMSGNGDPVFYEWKQLVEPFTGEDQP